jgi:hypothetical protein
MYSRPRQKYSLEVNPWGCLLWLFLLIVILKVTGVIH